MDFIILFVEFSHARRWRQTHLTSFIWTLKLFWHTEVSKWWSKISRAGLQSKFLEISHFLWLVFSLWARHDHWLYLRWISLNSLDRVGLRWTAHLHPSWFKRILIDHAGRNKLLTMLIQILLNLSRQNEFFTTLSVWMVLSCRYWHCWLFLKWESRGILLLLRLKQFS